MKNKGPALYSIIIPITVELYIIAFLVQEDCGLNCVTKYQMKIFFIWHLTTTINPSATWKYHYICIHFVSNSHLTVKENQPILYKHPRVILVY